MTSRRTVGAAAALAAALLALAAPATGAPGAEADAMGGEVGGRGAHYHLTDGWDGTTDRVLTYGRSDDRVLVGDWNGDGVDTLAVRRGATYHLTNRLSGGQADRVVTYGRADDDVYVGDWDGDGIDTPVVRRGATYHFTNGLSGGEADRVVTFGRPDDVVVIGDWDGDGRDTFGVRRGATYHLKNSMRGGDADLVVTFGRADDETVVGDWDGDGRTTLGIRRGNDVHIRNALSGGPAHRVVTFGRPGDAVLVGDWDGDGSDSLGLRTDRRGQQPPTDDFSDFDAAMVDLINAERADAGVPAIAVWPALRAGALDHSAWMAQTGTFEHAAPEVIAADGDAAGCAATAENIFWGTYHFADDPEAVLTEYMSSASHRENILDPANRYIAIGTVEAANGNIYNTQRFASSCS
ncbi:CAP domain-containing protein [uncultured Georgenia sp.]|uniref:CAP domain-containing protein n=1 Tax=uncultured Georgenia sp. TaxID=378209 RepID=UPI0026120DC4|nr:CAP domain-containing protein [uncultured Georgenia sp.]